MRFSSLVCSLAAALAIVVLAMSSYRHAHAVGRFIDGCDSFGYSTMAIAFRQARKTHQPVDFSLHDEQTRWLIARCKENGLPLAEWNYAVAPHAFHYFAGTDQVGPQYPPGTGWMLSIFPRRREVSILDRWSIWFVAAGGLALVGWCAWRGLTASSLVLAGAVGACLSPFSWVDMASYSINATVLPLFAGTVLAWFAGRSRDWRLALALGLGAGLAFGLTVQIRLASALFVPAVALLFVPRRFGALAVFLAGVALAGVLPVLLHNHTITGQFLGTTYPEYDREQSLAGIPKNADFYFVQHARESELFYVCGLLAAVLIWLVIAGPLRAPDAKSWWRGHLGQIAAVLCAGGLSVAYFLTHVIAIHYYLTPVMLLVSLLLAFLFVALEMNWQETAADPDLLRAVRTSVAGAAAMVAFVGLGFGYQPLSDLAHDLSPPPTTPPLLTAPPEVFDAHAWVWADRYTSSIFYYAGHAAFRMGWTSAGTRRLIYGWIKAKGDPQYMVIDSPDMERLADEARADGWQLSPAGIVRDVPCFKMERP